ncbi:helix-turn-helix domain-containing protein [Polymorphospora rubra]|uniref:Transcriptional regulator n=1 Tax=Polymorphospora rubra TaxID=338584 RepID=A0A810N0R8_9ACTN|nr:helix-turn-helix domain-containing protein [Polymorphospora rubra]BCJ67002.1 transcriptional regulator [Polymorphospora rubra]
MPKDDLAARVAALEEAVARLTAAAAPTTPPARSDPGTFWALEGLRDRLPAEAGTGAVLFTGTVDLPTGEHYDWQLARPVDDLLGTDWSAHAGTLAALGHPVRLLLLRQVLLGTRTAAELAEQEGLGTTGQLYHHLRQLVGAGWLRSSSRGHYTVPAERVVPLLTILSGAIR